MCLQGRLIIELDGGQHAQEADYDAARDAWLREQGFIILRFWNNDVRKNIDGVLEMIVKGLQGAPYLNPSPRGEGRKREPRRLRRKTARKQVLRKFIDDNPYLTHH